MKARQLAKLKEKSVNELKKKAEDLRLEIVKKRAKIASGKEKNIKSVRNLRKERATVLTLLSEKKKESKKK